MKKIKYNVIGWIFLIFLLVISCTQPVYAGSTRKPSIKLNQSKVTIYKGESYILKATVTGTNKKVKWKSSNTPIAIVNSKGKVYARKPGICKVTATANSRKAVCTVVIKNKYVYTYAYNVNDFGKFKEQRGVYTVTVKPISSRKIKLIYRQNGKIESTAIATKLKGNIYTYVPKRGLYPGYVQKVIWEKDKKRFLFEGFEAGTGYYF